MKVVFVGDSPSLLNTDPNVAFVGAKCWPTLMSWIERLNLDVEKDCLFFNSHTEPLIKTIHAKYKNGYKIIALGKDAQKRLGKAKIKYCPMCHPSGLNRQLNDKEYVDKCIKECYKYIWGEENVKCSC